MTVTILGSPCTVKSSVEIKIVCETTALNRDVAHESVTPKVIINNDGGQAIGHGKETEFWYIDQSSSPYTWGCSVINNGGHFEIGTEEEPFCTVINGI